MDSQNCNNLKNILPDIKDIDKYNFVIIIVVVTSFQAEFVIQPVV